jgi:enediyne biosynthesis protein E4
MVWRLSGALVALLIAAGAFLWTDPIGVWNDRETWFADVSDAVGIDFMHDAGDLSKYQLVQLHGSGVALFDFDGDGWLDIYLLTQGGPSSTSINRLYRNMGDGTFKDVTAGSGLGFAGYSTGVAIGDVNNDGWPDVLVTQYGGVKLFLNRGDGSFADVSKESGLANPQWGSSASFVDYDKDGWLDLVIVNYLDIDPNKVCHNADGLRAYCGPNWFPGTVTRLFRNLTGAAGHPGGGVRFEDVTVKAGLAKAPGPGLGVYCADFNGDGWPDIFVANDGKPNHLWINQGDGAFTEQAILYGLAVDAMGQAQAGMGVAAGDVDGDGRFDLYVAHLSTEHNTLWQQQARRGQFQDRTAHAGLLRSDWRGTGFGTLMGDFDQNGWLDIAVVNGAAFRYTLTPNPDLGDHLKDYSERNQLFRNEGLGKFRDISRHNVAMCGTPNVARALAAGDLDGDGALDLVYTTVAGRARVLRNIARRRGHWLLARAFDPRLKRDAYGAEVTVRAGGRALLRIVNPADSFQSSSDPRAHFGLGAAGQYESIQVRWPDGLVEVFPGGPADRIVVLQRGGGTAQNPKSEIRNSKQFQFMQIPTIKTVAPAL